MSSKGVLAKRTSDGGGFNAADPAEDKLLRRVARKTTTGMPEEPSNSSVKAGGSLVGDDISSNVATPSRNHAFGNASVQDRGPSNNGGGTGTIHNRASSIRGTIIDDAGDDSDILVHSLSNSNDLTTLAGRGSIPDAFAKQKDGTVSLDALERGKEVRFIIMLLLVL